mgnify:CR=1 FL=1
MQQNLYDLLDVAPSASAEEVRRAYRKLALQLHPDKNPGGGGGAPPPLRTFAEVNEAHEILSQPRRREIYDAFGLDGLRLYEGAYELARANRVSGTVLPPVMLVGVLAAATMVIAACLLAFVALVALRFDGRLGSTPWGVLFVPLFVADPVGLLVAALVAAEAPGQLRPTVYRLLPAFALHVCFQALLCLRLSSPRHVSWLAVFAPLLIGRGAAIAALLSERLCPRRGVPPPRLTSGVAASLLLALQLSLFAPKLEGELGWRWHLVLLPSWLLLLGQAAVAAAYCSVWRKPPRDQAQVPSLVEHTRAAAALVGAAVGAIALGWFGSVLEGASDEGLGARYSVVELVAPALALLAVYLTCMSCGCSAMRSARRRRAREAGGGGGAGGAFAAGGGGGGGGGAGFQMPYRTTSGEREPLVPSGPSPRAVAPPAAERAMVAPATRDDGVPTVASV